MLEGIALGVITWLSFVLSWWHLPGFVKRMTFRFPVLSDLGAGLLAFLFLSGVSKSLIAVIGAMVTGLLVNFSIMLGRHTYD